MQWNATLYDQQHDFVSHYGSDLLTLLQPRSGERILDLGCGTGDLAEAIHRQDAFVTGLDASPEMIAAARLKYPHLSFEVGSAEAFLFAEPFDAIFSNATLHWVRDSQGAAQSMYQNVKRGGRLVLEFGGKGNVAKLIEALCLVLERYSQTVRPLEDIWYFPSLGDYAGLLERIGFEVRWAALFERPTPLQGGEGLKNWLRQFAAPFLQEVEGALHPAILEEVEALLRPTRFIKRQWVADYVRLRLVALK